MPDQRRVRPPALWLLAVSLLAGAASARAAEQGGCLTADCHAAIRQGRFLHGPIAGGMCPICHSAGPAAAKPLPAGHAAVRTEKARGVCLECHEEIRALLQLPSVHTPVADGDCVDCHSPHHGENRFFLKYPPAAGEAGIVRIAPSCHGCHTPGSPAWFDEFHAGESSLDCTVCHNAHAAGEQYQLTGYVRSVYLQATLAEAAEKTRAKDLPGAIAAYRRALVMSPEDAGVRVALGRVYLAAERWPDAQREFDQVLSRLPSHVEALLGAGAAASRIVGPYAGLKHLNRALEISPGRADLHLEVGTTYRALGQLQEALASLTRAVELDPGLAEAHLQLSLVLEGLGKAAEAAREREIHQRLGGR